MNRIQIDISNPPQVIHLGRRGENLATEIVFDCSALCAQYGMGNAELLHQSSHGIVYPAAAVQDGVFIHWTITSCDTACEGIGKCELHWLVNDTIMITAELNTLVYHSLSGCAGNEPPESSASWVETVLQASQSAKASAQAAKTAPYITESGTWALYNCNAGAYIDSGLPSRGEKGEKGEKGDSGKDGAKGDKGDSPVLSSSVTSSSTTTAASSKAVKTAYDKAADALSAANSKLTDFDSGWVTCDKHIRVRKRGGIVTIVANGNDTDIPLPAYEYTTVGTIPSGYRPDIDISFAAAGWWGGSAPRGCVYTSGEIQLIPNEALDGWWTFTVSYPVA